MARILFISDSILNENLGIMYLSSYLKANGHDTQLFLLSEYKRIERLLRSIRNINPELIGFSVMTPQVNTFLPITKIMKENTQRKIIWGGPHCIFMPDNVMGNGYVDIICTGEGEEALLTLMNRLEAKEDYSDIPSLWVRNGEKWIKNDIGYLESNLDKYPFPDRELYYSKHSLLRNFGLKRLITQRGCPYECSYCFEPILKDLYSGKGKLVRHHSVEYVINEVKGILHRYPTRMIHFSDDTFNLNREWLMDFLPKFKENINLPFTCNISVLHSDEKVIKNLKEAGCNGVIFGLESGVESIRMNILNKKVSNQKYIEASRLLRKYKLKFVANIMFCLPNENLDVAIESIRFAESLKPYYVRAAVLKIYKGTKLGKFAIENDLCVATGEFTYKSKDFNNEHESIKNMIWVAFLFVKFPSLITFAKKILNRRISKFLKPLILLYYWQEARFLNISSQQSLRYFWQSRKIFMKGLGGEQLDTYKKIQN